MVYSILCHCAAQKVFKCLKAEKAVDNVTDKVKKIFNSLIFSENISFQYLFLSCHIVLTLVILLLILCYVLQVTLKTELLI